MKNVCVYVKEIYSLMSVFNQGNVNDKVNFCDFDYFVAVEVKKNVF